MSSFLCLCAGDNQDRTGDIMCLFSFHVHKSVKTFHLYFRLLILVNAISEECFELEFSSNCVQMSSLINFGVHSPIAKLN